MSSQEERTWGALAHVIPLVASFVTGFGWLAALAIYFVYREKSRFVAFNALQQVYASVAMFLVGVVCFILAITVVGILLAVPLGLAAAVAYLVLSVIAAIKANEGTVYCLPAVGEYARKSVGI
ncbi:MAG: DUF4870 domain-containing protein [Fimbriimonadaceae bacterium]|nr:DUF4870 domain-containing protein [Fimbriimonadaceae bacterium]QYK58438.1 MAG: DUF4870 domain-containing protein [Fimbriimonadaceae bacterium]